MHASMCVCVCVCARHSGTPDLMPGYNPATWMLEVTGGSMATLVEVTTHTHTPMQRLHPTS